ncbi:hypothetical protein LSAT2_007484 [Lamellibrachia satsuma]|nr:hypothetical protein LSAT2_007484 [Lamellibrachia satsuma]
MPGACTICGCRGPWPPEVIHFDSNIDVTLPWRVGARSKILRAKDARQSSRHDVSLVGGAGDAPIPFKMAGTPPIFKRRDLSALKMLWLSLAKYSCYRWYKSVNRQHFDHSCDTGSG